MKNSNIKAAWQGQAECLDCGIRDLVLFADLEENDFHLIHQPIDDLRFDIGAVMYHAGEQGSALYTVRSGLVKLVQYLPDGGQRIVRLLRQGDVAGLEILLGQPYQHTAIVLQPVQACRLPRQVVETLSTETPRIHQQLLKRWQRSLAEADAWLTELSTGTARARVARLLLRLVGNDPQRCCLLFSREDMGAMLGITTETASRIIAEFKRSGVAKEIQPHVLQCDLIALKKIAEE